MGLGAEGEMAEDMCVLSNMGWLDEQGEFVEEVFGTQKGATA